MVNRLWLLVSFPFAAVAGLILVQGLVPLVPVPLAISAGAMFVLALVVTAYGK